MSVSDVQGETWCLLGITKELDRFYADVRMPGRSKLELDANAILTDSTRKDEEADLRDPSSLNRYGKTWAF